MVYRDFLWAVQPQARHPLLPVCNRGAYLSAAVCSINKRFVGLCTKIGTALYGDDTETYSNVTSRKDDAQHLQRNNPAT